MRMSDNMKYFGGYVVGLERSGYKEFTRSVKNVTHDEDIDIRYGEVSIQGKILNVVQHIDNGNWTIENGERF